MSRPSPAAAERCIFVNEDNAHFYDYHPHEDMSVDGLNRLVDTYVSGTRVRGVLFNVNVQRALFDSKAWEPLYHDYDPAGPDDQPALQWLRPEQRRLTPGLRGRYWVHNLWLLKSRGIDHPQVWLDRCRHHGVEAWLSMRMNDCHHNDQPDAFWHPTLWRQRPDLHRAAYRAEGWWESGFDYGKDEVVDHHLRLVDELADRYDMDGLELDWLRWVKHFVPGHEHAGRRRLTAFMRQVRSRLDVASRRTGRTIRIAVRVPADPAACLAWGFDAPTWVREGLVDDIVLGIFLGQCDQDFNLELWRGLVGDRVRLLCQCDSAMAAYPNAGTRMIDYRLLYGACASALHRGADGVYYFNECYREGPGDAMSAAWPNLLGDILTIAGDAEGLRDHGRRHPVTYPQIAGPGQATASPLPMPLQKPKGANDFARCGDAFSLRLVIGPKPASARVQVRLGFDDQTPQLQASGVAVWLNGVALEPAADLPPVPAPPIPHEGQTIHTELPPVVRQSLVYDVPAAALQEDVNVLDLLPPKVPGSLVWAELIVWSG